MMKYKLFKDIRLIIYFILEFLPFISSIKVNNENDLIQLLTTNENDEITLEIESQINLSNSITVSKPFKKINFIGSSIDTSIIKFKWSSFQLNFGENIQEISFNNLAIVGNIYFNNNRKIDINTLALTGNIHSKNYNNDYIKIANMTYTSSQYSAENCILFEGGNVEIKHSTFHGNSSCRNRLFNFYGFDKYKLSIRDSYFNGNNQCPFFDLNNALYVTIEDSTFEKGYSRGDITGGGVIKSSWSFINIENCLFKDIISIQPGGAFNLNDIYDFKANNLEIYNTTSLTVGSVMYIIISEEVKSLAKFTNIKQYNTGNMDGMTLGGLIMCLEKFSNVQIENYYAENLINNKGPGCAFIVSDYSKLSIRNVEIDKMRGKTTDGLFIFSYRVSSVTLDVYNVKLNDFYQLSDKESATFIWIDDNVHGNIEKVKITNSGGYQSTLMHLIGKGHITIRDMEVNNFYSNTAIDFIRYESNASESYVYLEDLKINNVISQGVLFRLIGQDISLVNCEIKNIHICNKNNSCTNKKIEDKYKQDTGLFYIDGYTVLTVNNTLFENVYGKYGMMARKDNEVYLNYNTFKNCHFQEGLIKIHQSEYLLGRYFFNYTNFYDMTAKNGVILNINEIYITSGVLGIFENSKFENITASNYGGLVYSISKYTDRFVHFQQCEFKNIHALIGHIAYSLDLNSEPDFSNIDELKQVQNNFATNPTSLRLNEHSVNSVSLYSGEKIPEAIYCHIYDDYNNLITFETDTSTIQYDEFIFFNVEINDTYNVELFGQHQSFCWSDSCEYPPLQVVGNPGNYLLRLTIQSFGKFSKFINNKISISVNIKECNSTYINQSINNARHKSCYKPTCEPSCNQGKCVNVNLCDCSNTLFTGSNCNEYIKLEENKKFNTLVMILSILLIIITLATIIVTLYYRNNTFIKGGGIDFLIIILVGLIIDETYPIFITIKTTKLSCYLGYISNNIGFSLVFGSIIVKTYRIYKIFHTKGRKQRSIKKTYMYGLLIFLCMYHIILTMKWILLKDLRVETALTSDYKEYIQCHYPESKNISLIINSSVIIVGIFLSYSIRNVNKEFKENLAIPIYVIVIFTILEQVLEMQTDISIKIQIIVSATGALLKTFVVLYYLYFTKFYTIYIYKTVMGSKQSN
ncbi:hypothetical protein BCR36DRAFT_416049, partial [Piromyces finnis]